MAKSIIDGLFGKSPIRPLQQHMTRAHSCIKQLNDIMIAMQKQDWDAGEKIRTNISKNEQEADVLKKKLRMGLPSTFMMPFSRRDLLDLLLIQDSIANISKDVSGLICNRKMIFPKEISKDVVELTKYCVKTSSKALKAINELDELLETAFGDRERKRVGNIIKEINNLESKTDSIQHKIRKKLFPLESTLPAVDVVFYYRAIELLGELADSAQKVGSRLEVLLAK
jgi:hypothetical protein